MRPNTIEGLGEATRIPNADLAIEIAIGGNHVDAGLIRAADGRAEINPGLPEDLMARIRRVSRKHLKSEPRVPLRIEIHYENPIPSGTEFRGEVDRYG